MVMLDVPAGVPAVVCDDPLLLFFEPLLQPDMTSETVTMHKPARGIRRSFRRPTGIHKQMLPNSAAAYTTVLSKPTTATPGASVSTLTVVVTGAPPVTDAAGG